MLAAAAAAAAAAAVAAVGLPCQSHTWMRPGATPPSQPEGSAPPLTAPTERNPPSHVVNCAARRIAQREKGREG